MASPQQRLAALPRGGLVDVPTPLHRMPRLSAATGHDLWIKRDDAGPVATAGNKIRKFDFVLGDALRDGADLLITTGAAQSNSARAGAAAAAVLGIECLLLLAGDPPAQRAGNLLLDDMLGARTRFLGDISWAGLAAAVEAEEHRARAQGRRPVTAPVGCSSPLGALGFAAAYLEARRQWVAAGLDPAAIVHASSSLGTHAGLLVGRAIARDRTPVIGVDVAAIHADPARDADRLAQRSAAILGLDLPAPGASIDTRFLGPGYGIPDRATARAIDSFARLEGVILDPVYSGKGAAGLLRIAAAYDGPVLFWHTGGYHALFDPLHARLLRHARQQESGASPE